MPRDRSKYRDEHLETRNLAHTHPCKHTHIHTHTGTHAHALTGINILAGTHSGTHRRAQAHIHTQAQVSTHKHPHTGTQTQIHTHAGTCIKVHTQETPRYTGTSTHKCTCPGTHSTKEKRAQAQHISAHAHAPAHTHLYTHTSTQPVTQTQPPRPLESALPRNYPSSTPGGGRALPLPRPPPFGGINSVPLPLPRTACLGHQHSPPSLPTPGRPVGSKAHQQAAWVRRGASDNRPLTTNGPPRRK